MIFIIELVLIVGAFVYQYNYKKNYKIPIYLATVLALTAGLRYNYKLDYENYRIIFNEITAFSDIIYSMYEEGFVFCIFLFRKLGFGFYTFMLTVAVVSVFLKYRFFNKFSTIPIFSFLIYFLLFFIFNDMEQIRHGLAIAIALSGTIFILEDRFWKFAGVVLIASLIHYSAVPFLLLYFVRNIKFNKKSMIISFLLIAAFSFVDFMYIIKFINDNFINSQYLTNKLNLYANQSISIITFTLLIRLAIAIIYFVFVYNPENKQNRIFFNAYFIGICIFCIFRSTSILGIRSSIYFRYFELLLIPEYVSAIKRVASKHVKYFKKVPAKVFHYTFVILLVGYYIIKFVQTLSVSDYFSYFSI